MRLDELEKLLRNMQPTVSPALHGCWCQIWSSGLGDKHSLQEGVVLAALKEVVVRPLLKKAALNPSSINIYCLVVNMLVLGMVLEWMVALQF